MRWSPFSRNRKCARNPAKNSGGSTRTALIEGLEAILELGLRECSVQGDSQLVIRQMKGEYAVRAANLIPLYERAKGLVRKVGKVTFGWVPREQNRMADFQSRLGLYGSVRQKAMDVLSNYIIEDTEGGVVFRSPKDTVWTVTKDEDGLYRCDCPAFARSRHMPCKHCGAAYYRSLACSG